MANAKPESKSTRKSSARVKMKKPLNRRRSSATTRRSGDSSTGRARNFLLPVFLSFCLFVCLCAIGALGYQSVTASDFFNVAKVDVYGTERSSQADIRK